MPKSHEESRQAFTSIYEDSSWGFGSGIGSLPETTLEYRYFLEKFIAKNDIATIVDFGCGDWQFSRYIYWWDAEYTGYDAVEKVIDRNNRLYSTDKITFLLSPENFSDTKSADLLIVKDVFQHWSSNLIQEFIAAVKGKFTYILITNSSHPDKESNKDIRTGQFRPINLLIPPFNIQADQVLTYTFHCVSPNGREYSDFKTVLLLKNW